MTLLRNGHCELPERLNHYGTDIMKTEILKSASLLFTVILVALAISGVAQAKGYSPKAEKSSATSQDLERRLERLEADHKQLEEALTAELAKLRADLSVAREQQIAKTSIDDSK